MATRPDKFPEWARVSSPDPIIGGLNVQEPPSDKKDLGWERKEKPPAPFQNWLHWLTWQWLVFLDANGGAHHPTGEVQMAIYPDPKEGWVKMDDGTIGDASSGASNRANADTEDLFTLLWEQIPDQWCPVRKNGESVQSLTSSGTTATLTTTSPHGLSNGDTVIISGANEAPYNGTFVISNVTSNGFDYTMSTSTTSPATGTIVYLVGRGASAAVDFSAHKKITLFKTLGRVIGCAGSGAGLTPRVPGEFLGEEAHQQTIAELAAHNHLPGQAHEVAKYGRSTEQTDPSYRNNSDLSTGHYQDYSSTTGSSTPFNVMQPSTFLNFFIKL